MRAQTPPMSLGAIAAELGLTKSTVARNLRAAEARVLVFSVALSVVADLEWSRCRASEPGRLGGHKRAHAACQSSVQDIWGRTLRPGPVTTQVSTALSRT